MYVNVEHDKSVHSSPSTNQTGPRSSDSRCHGAVVLCLGLLSVFLLAGLIVLGVHHYNSAHGAAAELSSIKDKLTELLQDRIPEQKKTCPAGWMMFSYSCYLLSTESGSWTKGREDCRKRGADLVVINSAEEQTFLSPFTRMRSWIGLSDRDEEGTWRWIDGTLLTLTNWDEGEPNDNGASGEDCAEINFQKRYRWNDLSCEVSLQWICEKKVQYF
ncbi:CD209 antigen-like protein C [Channa argus]|uniref:CD209 antigen-like protein C n=1 Tax=Channa argus TaxID=215402 RepID=UPI0035227B3D